jgi:hypothetical protein
VAFTLGDVKTVVAVDPVSLRHRLAASLTGWHHDGRAFRPSGSSAFGGVCGFAVGGYTQRQARSAGTRTPPASIVAA